jgi:exodeoxyribonuclease VII small subunit
MADDKSANADDESQGLEASMEKLELIVSDLESGEYSLEEALKKFEEGLRLGKRCRQILERAELRVKQLVADAEGALEEKEFEGGK